MTSGNALAAAAEPPESTSGNKSRSGAGALPAARDVVLADYAAALERSPLAPSSRAKYLSRVRGFLAWLAESDVDGDPLADRAARDWAVRDYRGHMKTVRKAPAATINLTLAALDDFYRRRGLGAAAARREDLPRRDAPRALEDRQAYRYLRTVEQQTRPRGEQPLRPGADEHPEAPRPDAAIRDRALALLLYYAGLRDAEVAGLDVDDVRISARKGELRVLGKGSDGGKQRTVPIHADLRPVLQAWLAERPRWPGAEATPALLLNRRAGRLSDRSVRAIIGRLGELAGLDDDPLDPFGPHVLRHTFGTQLVRAGVDLVTVAELMGHARLDTTRIYTLPTKADRERALDALLTDR